MSNNLRKIRRNNVERIHGTRDHNFKHKLAMKKAAEEIKEKERREQEKVDKNLNLE